MDDYVAKPIDPERMFAVIEALAAPADEAEGSFGNEPNGEWVWDRQALLQRVQGDAQLLKEVTELFLADYPVILARVQTSLERGDGPGLEQGAHTLGGLVANFGAERAHAVARQLEQMGPGRRPARGAALAGTLEQELTRLVPALNALLNEAA